MPEDSYEPREEKEPSTTLRGYQSTREKRALSAATDLTPPLIGYVCKCNCESRIRIYPDSRFTEYVEVDSDDVVHSENIFDNNALEFGGTRIWLRPDAEISHIEVDETKKQASFLKGSLIEKYLTSSRNKTDFGKSSVSSKSSTTMSKQMAVRGEEEEERASSQPHSYLRKFTLFLFQGKAAPPAHNVAWFRARRFFQKKETP